MIHLTETTADHNGTYTTNWHCKPPKTGTQWKATDQAWAEDHTVRHIYQWETA